MKTTKDFNLAYVTAKYDGGEVEKVWIKSDGERALEDIVADVQDECEDYINSELKTQYVAGPLLQGWTDTYEEYDDPVWEHRMSDIRVDPEEPENCSGNWISPLSLFGGLAENPGVHGRGGGVIVQEVCPQTGWYKTTNTYDQNCTGNGNPVESIEYAEPDHESLEWVYRVLAAEIAEAIDGIEGGFADESFPITAIAEDGCVTLTSDDDRLWNWELSINLADYDLDQFGTRAAAYAEAFSELLGADGLIAEDLREFLES